MKEEFGVTLSIFRVVNRELCITLETRTQHLVLTEG